MKKITLLAIFCLALFLAGAQTYPRHDNTCRVMSYNIHHGEGMDGIIDIDRIGKLIIDIDPDVVGLQEIDSVTARSANIDIMRHLSEQTGMYATFGFSILYDGGKYGNGILTREKPVAVRKIALPGADEARTALIVELNNYVVVNTHLSLNNEERLQSVKIITDAVSTYDKPVILTGDLNATPDSAPIQFLEKGWQILSDPGKHTFPSVNPKETIDYILGFTAKGKSYTKYRSEVIDEQIASDHRPLFADFREDSKKF